MSAKASNLMSLYSKPSEFYKDLQKRPELLQVLVWSDTLAKNIIDLSLRSDDELSEWVTRYSALLRQSTMMAKQLYDTFSERTKTLFANMYATTLNWQGVKVSAIGSLVEAMQDVVAYSARDAETFVTNFAKDPKLLDKEYFVKKLGATNVVSSASAIYNNKGQETFEHRDLSLPNNLYLAGKKLIRWDDDTREMMPVLHQNRSIMPTLFFFSKEEQFVMIDKNRGIFIVSDDGSVDKSLSVDDYELENYVGARYATFKDKEWAEFFVDIYRPSLSEKLPTIPDSERNRKLSVVSKIDDIFLMFQEYSKYGEQKPGAIAALLDDKHALIKENILWDKEYDVLRLIDTIPEDEMFLIEAKYADKHIYDYYMISSDRRRRNHLVGTVGEGVALKNDGGYGYTHPTYDPKTKTLSVTHTIDYPFWTRVGRAISIKPEKEVKEFNLTAYINYNKTKGI